MKSEKHSQETDRSPPPWQDAGRFSSFIAALRKRSDELRDQQSLPDDVLAAMKDLGLYRALLSREFGGDEVSPTAFLKVVEKIASANGSTGWLASFGIAPFYLSALPMQTLRQIYGAGPDIVFACGLFPSRPARRVPGGYEVSGLWKFASGSLGADLIGVGIHADDTNGDVRPRMAVMPRNAVTIRRNWDAIGLRATGSHDILVENVFVPDDWTFLRGQPSTLGMPHYRYPTLSLAAQGLAIVGLGIARAALDEIIAVAGMRASLTGGPVLAERAHVQIDLAKAEAKWRSARAFFYEVTDSAYDQVISGYELSASDIALLRLASSHAAHVGADVARVAYGMSGTSGIYEDSLFAQYLQDAIVVPQHAFLSEATFQSTGRVLLGLPATPGFP